MKQTIINSKYVKEIFKTQSNEVSEWFGYYNYDPLNNDQTKLLCNRCVVDGIAPEKGQTIELGYYDLPSGVWHHIDDSDSWNWQQGSMLQWVPGRGNENKVIFNRSDTKCLRSRIIDVITGAKKDIDWPIYGITSDGTKSISLDLERSYWCRAYHYQSIVNSEKDGPVLEFDGIFEVDLTNNTRKRIISIQDIINVDYSPEFDTLKHWIEHIMISPDGTKFCFLHRYSHADNVLSYKTRLFVADINGKNLQLIGCPDKVDRSHFGWAPDNSFVIYSYMMGLFPKTPGIAEILKQKPINLFQLVCRCYLGFCAKMPKRICSLLTNRRSLYQYYTIGADGKYRNKCNWKFKEFEIDGHPSFTKDSRYMITDTYPDREGYQRLLLFDLISKKRFTLAEHYAFYKGNPASCDLHPKLSSNNNFVVVDSAYDNKHHMIVYMINWQMINNCI